MPADPDAGDVSQDRNGRLQMNQKKAYEGMFVLDAGPNDFESACACVESILARSEAEVLATKPWDEKRLAYPIRGCKRGLYVITYFRADGGRIAEIEHDCQIDERILRVLMLRREELAPEQVAADTPATARSRSRAGGDGKPSEPAEAGDKATRGRREDRSEGAGAPEAPKPEAAGESPKEPEAAPEAPQGAPQGASQGAPEQPESKPDDN